MKPILKIIICIIVSFLFFTNVFSSEGDAGQPGAFLRYGVGGRALGMGRAFVAVADDASGVYWNPAGILGAKRIEFVSTYLDLYYDSQFAQLGFVVPRPGREIKNSFLRFLIGPSSAVGFGWINLSMAGFEQRTQTGAYLGDFGMADNAFLMAWAREQVGPWGIFRYGLTFKLINQDVSGLQYDPLETAGTNSHWSGGMDVGLTFQPIHAPILRVIALKYLVPLRMGISLQNIVQPSWSLSGKNIEKLPLIFRWGFSYRWVLKDWIPESWEGLRDFIDDSQIITAFDKEVYKGAEGGNYFGVEGYFPIGRSGFAFFPRAGFNNRTEGPSLGMGLTVPFTKSTQMRIDYALGFHPYLPNDSRFFLTLQTGKDLGSKFFKQMSEKENIKEIEKRNQLLLILADYPNKEINGAVKILADFQDSTNARRYYDLSGGLGRAALLMNEVRSLLKQGNVQKAKSRAFEAAEEYRPVFMMPEHTLSDDDLMNYAEALILSRQVEVAIPVLEEVGQHSLKYYFMVGSCYKELGKWDTAIEAFQSAIKRYEQEQDLNSMVCLSFLNLSEILLRKKQYLSALTSLNVLLKNYPNKLDEDYPRYPLFSDNYVADDAVFLIGVIYLIQNKYREGVISLLEAQRFYPDLDYGKIVAGESDSLIDALENMNWEFLENLGIEFLEAYFKDHQLN